MGMGGGGLSPFYPARPKVFYEGKEMTLWSLLQADCRGVSYVVDGVNTCDYPM
ncbi:hypothetical protein Hanom_Chr02g00177971 [Helianthus anomalus]